MTLDASGAPGAAASPSRDDSDRSPEAPDKGLRILEALLADPSAVSSEEAVLPSGPMPEPSSRDDALGDDSDSDRWWSDRLPPDGSLADLVPAPPVPALQPAPGSVPAPDTGVSADAAATDSLAALSDGLHDSGQDRHAELDDDTARWDAQAERDDASSVPTKAATRIAVSAALEESAGTSLIEDVPSRDVAGENDLLVVRADTHGACVLDTHGARVLDTVAADADATDGEDSGEHKGAGDSGLDWQGAAATPEVADPETPADPPAMDHRDDTPGEHAGGESALSVAAIAALLDDALVRDIGEMPSISSDSLSLDAAGGAALAARPRDAGAEHLREGSSGPLSESVPRDADTASAVDSPPHGAASPAGREEPVAAVLASLEAAEGMVPAEQEEPEAADESIANQHLDALDDSQSNASPLHGRDEPGLGSFTDVRDPGEAVAAFTAEGAADADEVEIGGGPDSADQLPQLGIAPRAETEASGHGTLVREISDAAADSSGEVAGRGDAAASGVEEDGAAAESMESGGPVEEFVPAGGGAQDAPRFDAPAFGTRNSDSIDRDGTPTHEEASLIPGSPPEGTGVDELAAGDVSGAASGSDDAQVQEGASPVICLPDLGGMSPSEAAAGGEVSLLQSTEDVASEYFGDPAGLPSPGFSGPEDTSARAHVESPESLAESEGEVTAPESAPVIALPGPGDKSEAAVRSLGIETNCEPGEPPRGLAGRAEEETAGAALVDALLRDMAGSSSVSSDEADTPDTASGASVPDDDSVLDAGRPAGRGPGATSLEPFDPVFPEVGSDASGSADEAAGSNSAETNSSEGIVVPGAPSEYAGGLVEAGQEDPDGSAERIADERRDAQTDLPGGPPQPPGSIAPCTVSSADRTDSGVTAAHSSTDAAAAASTEDTAATRDGEVEEGAESVIRLPDLSGSPSFGRATGPDDALLRQIAEVVAASAGEAVESSEVDAKIHDEDAPARDPADVPEDTEEASPDDVRREYASETFLPEARGPEDGVDPIGSGDGDEAGAPTFAHGDQGDSSEAYAAATDRADALLRDMTEAPSVSSDQTDTPDFPEGDLDFGGGSGVDADAPADPSHALHAAESLDPAAPGSADEPGGGGAAPTTTPERAPVDSAHTEDASHPVQAGLEDSHGSTERTANERGDLRGDAVSLPGSALREAEPSNDRRGLGEASIAVSTGNAAGADDAVSDAEEGAGSVILLPDSSTPTIEADTDAGRDDGLLRQAADAPAASLHDAAETPEAVFPGVGDTQARSIASPPGAADEAALEDSFPEDAGVFVLPDSGEATASDRPVENREQGESHRWPDDPTEEAETATSGIVFDDSLALDLAETVPVSFDEAVAAEPAFDISLPNAQTTASDPSAEEPDPSYADVSLEAAPPGPAAALAFATDADTEMALRDGLLGFGGASAGTDEAQVWQGGLRAAIAALAEGRSAPLVIVDIDGLPYPAGAIHELAAVCEVGTVVIAVGSDDSARPGRELLLAGVSDYLAKPLTAEAVRDVAIRALADAAASRPGGLVVSFAGCGGSGATTMATAAALQAAARGCYVSVLDLSRSVPAAALALGVDPVAGLDQLLETAAREAVEPEALEGVCARRSDRIEVYAHRWSPEHPAAASAEAVDSLLAVLRLRSQVVVVDGLDEAWTCFLPAAEIDTQVFVAEPTAGKTPQVARMASLLKDTRPLVFVQNHTRAFRRNGGGQVLRNAGIGIEPDVVVPFDPAVAQAADWGWPQDKLPRSVRKPVTALTDRLLGASPGAGAAPLAPARAA